MKKKIIIMGAAGRDFHNFNTFYRNNNEYEVVAFTATQIPDIEGRRYPSVLCGNDYPKGIPIYAEETLPELIKKYDIDEVVFAYSDVPHEYVMNKASWVLSLGPNFILMGPKTTMLRSSKPIISICAVRTGCGKSQTTRKVSEILIGAGKKVVVVRHPMPYGDLVKQKVQRFSSLQDLKKHKCTIEEMEEYEPHINRGVVVYAGVDYEAVLREAEKEADVILWDGGNNDLSFFEPNLEIVVADPHRPNHELMYHPGETNLRRADVVVINKMDSADGESIEIVRENIRYVNPDAIIVDGASPLYLDKPEAMKGKRVLIVEDGPTLTHGEMQYGAGFVAAQKFGAAEIVDPKPFAVGEIEATYKKYPNMGPILPAMGYGKKQIRDLEKTINRAKVDLVVIATPIDLNRIISIKKPTIRVQYELQEIGKPDLKGVLKDRKFI